MKKFLKNSIITISIIFLILNIFNIICQIFQNYMLIPEIVEAAEQVRNGVLSSEDSYRLLTNIYQSGFTRNIEILITILGLSILFGIAISLFYTFEENSKLKVILYYFSGMILIALIQASVNELSYSSTNLTEFFKEILYCLEMSWVWYTIGFIIIYSIKLFITNKKTKELNKILENKNKSE